jgi:hypothetical protein
MMRARIAAAAVAGLLGAAGCGGGGHGGGAPASTAAAPAASATRSSASASPAGGVPANGLAAATITVVVRDAAGVPVAGAVVSFAASGTGNTIAEPTQPTGVDGVATGTIASTVAERKTIAVTVDPGAAGAVVLAAAPVVDFSAAVRLAFVGAPGAAAAGAPIPGVAVAIVDASGAPFPGAADAVTIALGDARGAALGGTTTRGAVGGIAPFPDLAVDAAATGYTLIASASGFAAATSPPFDVAGGAAATLAFRTGPSDARSVAYVTPAVEVVALDAFGNVATGFGGPVAVALGQGAGSGALFGTTPKAAVAGLATFSNLNVDKTGTYSLVAAAPGLAPAASATFTISAGPPTALEIVSAPVSQLPYYAAGVALPPLIADVVDGGGNFLSGAAVTVTAFLASDGPGGNLLGTTAVMSTAGVATFADLALDKEGCGYRLAVALGAPTAGPPTQSIQVLCVEAAPFTHLAFAVEPASGLESFPLTGAGAAVTVQATDDFGNTDQFGVQNGTLVTLALAPNAGGAVLSGVTTATITTGGMAIFPGPLWVQGAGTGLELVATLASGAAGTSTPFDASPLLRVESFASDRARAQVGEQATLSWTISGGPPTAVTLDPGGKSEATAGSGSDQATPFPAAPAGVDPQVVFRLGATEALEPRGIEGLLVAKRATSAAPFFVPTGGPFPAALPDGSAIVAGGLEYQTTFGPDDANPITLTNVSFADLFLARYNPDLSVAWAVALSGDNFDAGIFFEGIAAAPDGGVFLGGVFGNEGIPPATYNMGPGVTVDVPGNNTSEMFVARYGADGKPLWVKPATGMGFAEAGDVRGIGALPNGGAIVAGPLSGTLTLGPNDPNPIVLSQPGSLFTGLVPSIFVARYEPDGTVAWAKRAFMTIFGSVDVTCLAAFPDGGAVVGGDFVGTLELGPDDAMPLTISGHDFYLARYGPDGTVAWAQAVVAFPPPQYRQNATGGLAGFPDGGFVFATQEGGELYLARYAGDGSLVWRKRATDSSSNGTLNTFVNVSSLAGLPDGGIIVSGNFYGTTTFGPGDSVPLQLTVGSGDNAEVFIAGFDAAGSIQWVDRATGQVSFTPAVSASADGSVFFTNAFSTVDANHDAAVGASGPGTVFFPSRPNNADFFFARYTPLNFALAAVRPEGLAFAVAAGGAGADEGNAVAPEADGGALVAGSFQGAATFGATPLTAAGTDDAFLARLGPDGTVAWAKQAGGAAASTIARGLAATLDGGAFAAGSCDGAATFGPGEANATTLAPLGGRDIFVARHAADGTLLWAKRAGGAGDDEALAVAALRPADGGALVTGYFNGTALFGPDDTMQALSAPGAADAAFLARYGHDGVLSWAARAGGSGATRGEGVAAFPDASSAVAGFFSGTATFGPDGPTPVTLTSAGGDDIFVARYDQSGALLWVRQAGGAGADRGLAAAAVAEDGSVLVTGFFSGSATFGADGAVPRPVTLVAAGAEDVFVARYDAAGNLVFAVSLGGAESDEGTGIAALPGGGAVVTGFETAGGLADTLLATFGPDGSLVSQKQANGTSGDQGLAVAALPDGSAFVTGFFQGTSVIFGLGEANETTLGPAAGATAIFAAKYFPYGP